MLYYNDWDQKRQVERHEDTWDFIKNRAKSLQIDFYYKPQYRTHILYEYSLVYNRLLSEKQDK